METNKILNADILDILFEGKNKEYGAYELRKTYNGRMVRALIVTGSVIVLLFTVSFISIHRPVKPVLLIQDTVNLMAVNDHVDPPPPPPPKPRIELPPVATQIFTPPKIEPDKDVPDDQKPPENDKLDDVKIGDHISDGAKDDGTIAPPVSNGVGGSVIEAPKKVEDDAPFVKVEIESTYPGGPAAWLRFLNKNLRVPVEEMPDIQGGEVRVMARFIVDKEGNISDVEIASGPDNAAVRNEVIRVIKKSGKWTPAQQNGRYVKSYKQQPVVFIVEPQ